MNGTILNERYQLGAELGRGGMGVVYAAHDLLLDRPVALKLLSGSMLGKEGRDRMLLEARSAARLAHPNIVAVYDAGEASSEPFIVMEFVSGGNLRAGQGLEIDRVIEVGVQLCGALEHAHAQGIVHRDLKPENVLVDGRTSLVKLADFGLAFARGAARLTSAGAMVGTADYLSPEQAMGAEVDPRTDLYALGCVLYELATARRPFPGDSPLAVISQHLHTAVVPPRTYRPDLPAALETIILRLMEKDPARRYGSAVETRAALLATRETPDGAEGDTGDHDSVRLLHQLSRGRLVGRSPELAQLREHWARALAGQGHMALVSGEPGVGKTRLARELLVTAQISGATVLRGGCYEYEASTPYLPFVEALGDWVRRQTDADLQLGFAHEAPDLARLVPEVAIRIGAPPAPVNVSPHEERLRLFEQFASFLQRIAARRGLLLFLDDLHWSDEGTLHLLHHLLRRLASDRVLILGAYREVELDRAHPLAAALVEWNRERLADRIALGRLDRERTTALLASLFDQETISQDFADAVFKETEGNPFFIEEVVKSLIEQGQIYRDAAAWQRRDVAELSIPQSVKEAIGRRLNRLSECCSEVLHVAAALGKQFEFRELAACLTQSEDEALDVLDEATSLQLLRPGSGESFAFTHDKIREVLYEEINPIRRRRTHLRIGEALEGLAAKGTPVRVSELAHHYVLGGQLEKALEYSLKAGREAYAVHVLPEALRHYEQALECSESLSGAGPLLEIYEGLAEVLANQGVLKKSAEFYVRALEHATERADRARIKAELGTAYCRGSNPRGEAVLKQALEELDPATQQKYRAMAMGMLGRYHHYRTELHEAAAIGLEAAAIATETDDALVIMETHIMLSGAMQHLGRLPESIAWSRKVLEIGERRSFPVAIATGWEMISEAMANQGRWDEAAAAAATNRQVAERMGAYDRVAWSQFADQIVLRGRGQLAECIRLGREGEANALRIGEGRLAQFIRGILASALAESGEIEEAAAMCEGMRKQVEELDQMMLRIVFHGLEGTIAAARGDWAGAAAALEPVIRRPEYKVNRVFDFYIGPGYALALLKAQQVARAREAVARYMEASVAAEAPYPVACLEVVRGGILGEEGLEAEALAAFARGIDGLQATRSNLWLARGHRERGTFLKRTGRAREATADLRRARDLFEECGAVPERAAMEAE